MHLGVQPNYFRRYTSRKIDVRTESTFRFENKEVDGITAMSLRDRSGMLSDFIGVEARPITQCDAKTVRVWHLTAELGEELCGNEVRAPLSPPIQLLLMKTHRSQVPKEGFLERISKRSQIPTPRTAERTDSEPDCYHWLTGRQVSKPMKRPHGMVTRLEQTTATEYHQVTSVEGTRAPGAERILVSNLERFHVGKMWNCECDIIPVQGTTVRKVSNP
jgi:hypothetical protein